MLMLMALLLRHVLLHSRVSEHTPLECSRTCRPSIVRACPPAPEMILLCAIIPSQQPTDWTDDWGRCDSTTTCILASVLVLVWCCTGGAPTIARTGHPPATTHIALRSSRECRHLYLLYMHGIILLDLFNTALEKQMNILSELRIIKCNTFF